MDMSSPVNEASSHQVVAPERENEQMISPMGVSPEQFSIPNAVNPEVTSSVSLRCMLLGRGHPFDASAMVISDQMSQMLLLLPSCVAKLGWSTSVLTVIFGLLSFWTALLVHVLYFQYYRTDAQINGDGQNEKLQWDKVLFRLFGGHGKYENLPGMLGKVFNGLCHLTRGIIQLSYAASIIYFVFGKLEKRTWSMVLASCCLIFAVFPTLRKHRTFSIFSLVIATVAAVCTAVASWIHKPHVQRVEHSVASNSIWSWAWVSCIIVYTFGGTPVSVETMVSIREAQNQRKFIYWFLGSTTYAMVLSLIEALSSYWVFGNELSKIAPAAQPCALALLPPSHLRYAASISLLILELVAIGHSLSPLFMYCNRISATPTCREDLSQFCACVSVVSLVCIIAVAIPFSGSMEITLLVGAFIVSPAVYVIPAAAHMTYFSYRGNREAGGLGLSNFAPIPWYVINIIQIAAGLIFIAIMGGRTSIKEVFYSHTFHHSDFGTRCYLCTDSWLSPPLKPISAPAPAPVPSQFVQH